MTAPLCLGAVTSIGQNDQRVDYDYGWQWFPNTDPATGKRMITNWQPECPQPPHSSVFVCQNVVANIDRKHGNVVYFNAQGGADATKWRLVQLDDAGNIVDVLTYGEGNVAIGNFAIGDRWYVRFQVQFSPDHGESWPNAGNSCIFLFSPELDAGHDNNGYDDSNKIGTLTINNGSPINIYKGADGAIKQLPANGAITKGDDSFMHTDQLPGKKGGLVQIKEGDVLTFTIGGVVQSFKATNPVTRSWREALNADGNDGIRTHTLCQTDEHGRFTGNFVTWTLIPV